MENNSPAAVAEHMLTMKDLDECYDLLLNNNRMKAVRRVTDVVFVVLCAFYTAASIFYLCASPPHEYTVADTAIILLMLFILVLTVMHFVRKTVAKRRYSAVLFRQLGTRAPGDHAEYYSDRVVVYYSKSRFELSYGDTEKLLEGKNVFILVPKVGASHIGRKDHFKSGSFEDFRKAYYGYSSAAN